MANLDKWNAPSAWTAVTFTAGDLNSLATGGGALGTTVIANGTNFDKYLDVSFVVTMGGTTVAGSYFTVYLLPLNQDGSTYGDGYASSTTTQPAIGYSAGAINVKVGVTSGSTVTGTVLFGNMAPGDYKVAFGNNSQVALNATAALTLKFRTYNDNLNA